MKSYLPIAALLSLALLVVGCQPAAEAAKQAQDVAAIKSVADQYVTATNAGDAAAVADLYTDDAILMPLNAAPAVVGKEAIQSASQALFDQVTLKLTGSTEEVEVAGDWAFSRNSYTATLTPKAGGEPTEAKVKCLVIYKRQPDGSWKNYRSSWNSDLPPPGAGE